MKDISSGNKKKTNLFRSDLSSWTHHFLKIWTFCSQKPEALGRHGSIKAFHFHMGVHSQPYRIELNFFEYPGIQSLIERTAGGIH